MTHQALPTTRTTLARVLTATALAAGIALTPLVAPSVSPLQAQAQVDTVEGEQTTLTAIPPRLGEDGQLKLKPGEKSQFTIRVRNSSSTSQNILTTKQDFVVSPEDGKTPIPVSDSVSNRWSLASWITLTPSEQTLAPNETGGISVLVEVPADALPGGHYAMITHQPASGGLLDSEVIGNEKASAVNQKVGTLLYVLVDGPINEEASVRNLKFPEFLEFGPVPYSFTVENRSDVHITPQTTIEIYNLFNQRVDTIVVNSQNVFPFTSREFSGEWERIWGWGLYKAKLVMSYGQGGQVAIAQTSFWLVPIKIVLAALIGLLSLIATFISVRRHWLHRSSDEQKKITILEERLRKMEQEKLKKYED